MLGMSCSIYSYGIVIYANNTTPWSQREFLESDKVNSGKITTIKRDIVAKCGVKSIILYTYSSSMKTYDFICQ